jgi:beta-alanine degradation protein BauB
MTITAAHASVQIDNDYVRVTEWRFAPGSETGWHTHELRYVVVPQSTGVLTIATDAGETQSELTSGVSYFREAGATHNVINRGETEFVFVEIEIK